MYHGILPQFPAVIKGILDLNFVVVVVVVVVVFVSC